MLRLWISVFAGTALGLLAACASAPRAGSPASPPPAQPAGAPAPPGAPAAGAPAAGGSSALYTAEQAQRGQRIYTTICGTCHGRTEFTGSMFQLTWMAEPLGHFFQHITTAMPQDDPGSLEPEEYAAVVAYLLQLNGRPAGDEPLPADAEALSRMSW